MLINIISFCRAYAIKRSMSGLTLALFGGRGMGQVCGVADPSQWMRIFGIDIDFRDTTELIEIAESVEASHINKIKVGLANKFGIEFSEFSSDRCLRLYAALRQMISTKNYDMISMQSFPGIAEQYALPYFAQSLLLDEGIATSSLGDCNSVLLLYILSCFSDQAPFCGDLQNINMALGQIDIVSDGIAAMSLASETRPVRLVSRGIETEGSGTGIIPSLILKSGRGALVHLGRVKGKFELSITGCSIYTPENDLEQKLKECGLPEWPHAFLKTECDLPSFIPYIHSECCSVAYGDNVECGIKAFSKIMHIDVVSK